MSRFRGEQHRGALRELRGRRRIQAETRNALTPPHRRARHGQPAGGKRKATDR